jgi:putative ABC transport system substrate-binding protein
MRRRTFIMLAGLMAARPLAARAQQVRKARLIGYLNPAVPAFAATVSAFSNGLRELGWIEGQNIVVERRNAENRLAACLPLYPSL